MDRLTVSDGTDTATLTGAGRTPDGDLARWRLEVNLADSDTATGTTADRERRLLEAATQAVGLQGGGRLEYWVERVGPQGDHVPTSAGFTPSRNLLRLRRELPALATDLPTRAFVPGDAEAFLAVNNLAFDWHPDQGGMTDADLEARQAETWYDPDGFLLHEVADDLLGFCWTKVHTNEDPPVGEIYAIAVHPEHHGKGLGRALTLAGLAHLAGRRLRHAILYVESDNRPALRLYRGLGFETEFTNRSYQRIVR